jgi:hypothetical protein
MPSAASKFPAAHNAEDKVKALDIAEILSQSVE